MGLMGGKGEGKSEWMPSVKDISPLLAYMASSIFLSFWNKFVLLRFPVASVYLCITFGITFLCGSLLLFTCYRNRLQDSSVYPTNISRSYYLFKLAPVGLLFGLDVVFTTLAIMQGSIPFVEMIKAGVPTFILVANILTGNTHKLNWKIGLCVITLTCGHVLLYITDVTFNTTCLVCSLLAMSCAASKLMFTESMASERENNNAMEDCSGKITQMEDDNYHQKMNQNFQKELDPADNEFDQGFVDSFIPSMTDLNSHHTMGGYISFEDATDIEDLMNEDVHSPLMSVDNAGERSSIVDNSRDVVNEADHNDVNVPIDSKPKRKLHPLLAIFYFMPLCIALCIITCVGFDRDEIRHSKVFNQHNLKSSGMREFLLLSLIGGIAAFVINLTEIAILAKSSALYLTCFVGGLKMVTMIGVSYFLFDTNTLTRHNALGYTVCGASILAYNWIQVSEKMDRFRQMKQAQKAREQRIHHDVSLNGSVNGITKLAAGFQSGAMVRGSFNNDGV